MKQIYFYVKEQSGDNTLLQTDVLTKRFGERDIHQINSSVFKQEFIDLCPVKVIEIIAKIVHIQNEKKETIFAYLALNSATSFGSVLIKAKELLNQKNNKTKLIYIKNEEK